MSTQKALDQVVQDYGKFLQDWGKALEEWCQSFQKALTELEEKGEKKGE